MSRCQFKNNMRYITILLLFCIGCGPPMTRQEQILFGAMVAAQAADYETTRQTIKTGGIELNPILGARPEQKDIALFKVGSIGVIWLLGEVFPDHRKQIYGLGVLFGGGAALHNSQ